MKRSEQRETIFKLLFMTPFTAEDEMEEQVSLYLENLKDGIEEVPYGAAVTEQDVRYMKEKLKGITEKIPELDACLNEASKGWKTSRMAKVDLSIMRLAVYEMKYDTDVPVGVAINEAVELAKRYGNTESAPFVNGVLGRIAREVQEDQGE